MTEGTGTTQREEVPAADQAPEHDPGQRAEAAQPPSIVINTFMKGVNATAANFGSNRAGVSQAALARETGPMRDADVDDAVEKFVAPVAFRQAAQVLDRCSLTVLYGPAGIGKRAGALALLRRDSRRRPIVVLSPGLSIEELRRYDYKPGRDYLILDRSGGKDDTATLSYGFDELANELAHRDARLVITTTAPRSEYAEGLSVAWEPPSSGELIDRYITDPSIAARVRAATDVASPREIVWIAEQLDVADGASAAIDDILEQAGLHTVTRWLDEDPPEDDVLLIVAVSFSIGLSETESEAMLTRLEWVVAGDHQQTEDEQASKPVERLVRQRRHDRLTAIPILTRRNVAAGMGIANAESSLAFTSDATRVGVLEQMWGRYDLALWSPVKDWLDAVIDEADSRVALSVTAGLTLLAKPAPQYVLNSYLKPWAEQPGSRRRAACYVIWHAAYDDALSSWALDCALTYARSPNANVKATAILCLAGSIGLRYPGEATRQLWRLCRKQGALGAEARSAIVTLTRNAALAGNFDVTPLRYIASQLARSSDADRGSRFKTALSVASALVAANDSGGKPLAAALAELPDASPLLGRIWATALVHRPHRRTALDGLARTIDTLGRSDGGLDRIRALGQPLLTHLSMAEQLLLRRELPPRLTALRAAPGNSEAIISALLEAGQHRRSGDDSEEIL